MRGYIRFADKLSSWMGKAFAWTVLGMCLAIGYNVFLRYVLGKGASWAYDLSMQFYGAIFLMGGAYTLSRDSHVRADFLYRLWRPRVQATVELILYFIFFFPGILALVIAGYRQAELAWRRQEVSTFSPARIPVYQYRSILVLAAGLLIIQGIAQVMRCILCIKTGYWMRASADVEETEKALIADAETRDVLHHSGEAVDLPEVAANKIDPTAADQSRE